MTPEESHLDIVRRYYAAMSADISVDEPATFYAPDVIQEEYPNRFVPDGVTRDLKGLQAAAARGKGVMSAQTFELVTALASGNTVVVEAKWSGTLGIPVGEIKAGTVMRARFAQFFESRDGKICSQRNYDCFEPW